VHRKKPSAGVVDNRVLVVEDVSFDYASGSQTVPVLDGLSFGLHSGEWVAVMGPSGSGKSTLLRCAAGLSRARSGEVVIDGVRVGTASERELTALRRGRIGFIFQEFNLLAALTAEENVGLPARFGGRGHSRQKVRAALEQVGLGEKIRRRPDQLSGGERQRVAIARALVSSPRVVFADEPTGALDVRVRDHVLDLFEALAERGAGVAMVTHDPLVAARADRVLWLSGGRIAETTPRESAERIAQRLAAMEMEAG
jgi:putative ABC transport system ATP-binding protein